MNPWAVATILGVMVFITLWLSGDDDDFLGT